VYAKLGKRYWAQERPSIESAVADLPANYVAMGDKIIDTDKLHLLPGKHYTQGKFFLLYARMGKDIGTSSLYHQGDER